MRLVFTLATAVGMLFPVGYGAAAQDQEVSVTGRPVTFAAWTSTVTKQLERNLYYPTIVNEPGPSGIVSITFYCNDAGLPTNLQLAKRSGSWPLDMAAMRAVRRIRTLHPLPDHFARGTRIRANILFATDQAEYDHQLALLRQQAAAQNARLAAADGPPEVVLNSQARAGA